jgi:hypothetical protein
LLEEYAGSFLPQAELTLCASRFTMHFFAGKHNHVDGYAKNELWTVLFPDSIKKDDPARVVCQWTETANSVKKENAVWKGKITKADRASDGHIDIDIFKDDSNLYYWYVVHHRGTAY